MDCVIKRSERTRTDGGRYPGMVVRNGKGGNQMTIFYLNNGSQGLQKKVFETRTAAEQWYESVWDQITIVVVF